MYNHKKSWSGLSLLLVLLLLGTSGTAAEKKNEKDLLAAVEQGDLKKAEELLAKGADANSVDAGNTPLLTNAVCADSPEMVELLLKHGADPNKPKKETNLLPIVNAIMMRKCNEKILDLLLKHGADINVKMWYPGGHNMITHFLKSRTMLGRNSDRIIRHLVKKGIDIKHKTDEKLTAADLAAKNLHIQYLSLLDFEAKYSSLRELFPPMKGSRFLGVWAQKDPVELPLTHKEGKALFWIGDSANGKEVIKNTSITLKEDATGSLFEKKGRTSRIIWTETRQGVHICVIQGEHCFYDKYPLEAIQGEDGALDLLYRGVRIRYVKAEGTAKE